MSLFDYPRINFQGTIRLNPGTANNDDLAGGLFLPDGPCAGETLGLIDSKLVQARTYGMSDEDFVAWAQKEQCFRKKSGGMVKQIPAEWNYYGDMCSEIVDAKVIGVQTAPDKLYTEPHPKEPLTALINLPVTYKGSITDINSEGSPPATQFFISALSVGGASGPRISGTPDKGTGQWISFFRNATLGGDGSAGSYVYHVLEKGPDNTIELSPELDPKIAGVIFRYYLYRTLGDNDDQSDKDYYKDGKIHPRTLEIAGTFAPLYKAEKIRSAPTGRLMVSNKPNIKVSTKSNKKLALSPAVLQQFKDSLSVDFIATFPDNHLWGASNAAELENTSAGNDPRSIRATKFEESSGSTNNKLDFGPVTLVVTNGKDTEDIGRVHYEDTQKGNQRGWLFDFKIPPKAQQLLKKDSNATFRLYSEKSGEEVSAETNYYFVSNQQTVYGEQFGSKKEFLNQGKTEPVTVSVFHRGRELDAASCPPITIWAYRSIPYQAPGCVEKLPHTIKPGQAITVDTSQPGNILLTFTIGNDQPLPSSYKSFAYPPAALDVTNRPSISFRILPNPEIFDQYYKKPVGAEPVGNESLTFDVVYEKVLRTYYLLYPAMNKYFSLNSEKEVAKHAESILKRTDQAMWMSPGYMPRTRDLSESRRKLLRAWCRTIISG